MEVKEKLKQCPAGESRWTVPLNGLFPSKTGSLGGKGKEKRPEKTNKRKRERERICNVQEDSAQKPDVHDPVHDNL